MTFKHLSVLLGVQKCVVFWADCVFRIVSVQDRVGACEVNLCPHLMYLEALFLSGAGVTDTCELALKGRRCSGIEVKKGSGCSVCVHVDRTFHLVLLTLSYSAVVPDS